MIKNNYAACVLLRHVQDRVRDVRRVRLRHASHRHAPVGRQINVVVCDHLRALLRGQPRERKHADLVGDVVPVAGRAAFHEVLLQRRPGADDPVGHALALGVPLRVEHVVLQDRADNARARRRRVGVHRPDDQLELRVDALDLVRVLAHDREAADAVRVQAKVLRKGLRRHDRVAVGHH